MEQTHIIFDLDGTLIDSRQEIINTYSKVFTEIPPNHVVDYNTINYGDTLQSILNCMYDGEADVISKAKVKFAEFYDNSSFVDTTLYPYVFDLLKNLHQNNFILHIATNKRLTPTINILKIKKMDVFFTSIKTSDMNPNFVTSKQEMVSQICEEYRFNNGYMIGDSTQDIVAGNNCKLTTIAALYGYDKKDNLLKNNPKFVINNFTELNTILLKEI
jgi:phosphoglycolate phosphatase